jgi:hypothetical protein
MSTHHTHSIGYFLVIYTIIFTAIMAVALAAETFFIK